MPQKLAIIIGSTRPGRVGPSVAQWVVNAAREHAAFDITLVDLKDLDLPLLDEAAHPSKQQYEHEHTKRWSAIVDDADAFVFVTPEYDYFAPAALVNAIQCLANEWQYKPAAVVSYGGVSGGLRSTQTLRLLLANLDVHPLKDGVSVQFVAKHIIDGVFMPHESAPAAAMKMLDELAKWSAALASLRS